MKKLAVIFFLVILSLGYSHFQTQYATQATGSLLDTLHARFNSDVKNVGTKLQDFITRARAFQEGSISVDQYQKAFSEVRQAYKRVEFLFEYLEPELTVTFINGAPLPKLEKHIPQVVVIEPNGLQTLDELVWLSPEESLDEAISMAEELATVWGNSEILMAQKQFQHRYVIEAIRYGVIRVFSLGVTGFDTPGCGFGMQESRESWQSMLSAFQLYQALLTDKTRSYYDACHDGFLKGSKMLRSTDDFTEFDHLSFIREIVNPLYRDLLHFHKAMQIEMKSDVDPTLAAHNYKSESIFSEDFFKPSFYTQIAEDDLTDPEKIELGKLLFYDPAMSKNLDMSCASCHDPQKGFADGLPKSKTNRPNTFTDRHAPTLLNSALYGRYFWDMREYDLERQIKHVVHNDLEFNMDFVELADRLKESQEYVKLFEKAYGDRDKYSISTWSISNSLAAYIQSLSRFDSPFDQYVNGKQVDLDEEVKKGYNLFMGKGACGTCHFAPSFSGLVPPFYKDAESEVLGVTTTFDTINPQMDPDPGRRYNGLPAEEADHFLHAFKTVTVRNTEITAPYFHNGAFESLEQVVHFYNKGGGVGLGLEIANQTLPPDELGLTHEEIGFIVSFMESLTDTIGLTGVPPTLPAFEGHPDWNDRRVVY